MVETICGIAGCKKHLPLTEEQRKLENERVKQLVAANDANRNALIAAMQNRGMRDPAAYVHPNLQNMWSYHHNHVDGGILNGGASCYICYDRYGARKY